MKKLVIVGAGGHACVIADIAIKTGLYEKIEFLDDVERKNDMGIPVVGKIFEIEKHLKNSDFFIGIGNCKIRNEIQEKIIALGGSIATLIHPNAVIGSFVEIGVGTAVMAGAVINPCVKIGKGVIVNTSSSIDHNCVIGDYSHISVGAHLAGTVTIGTRTWIGIGSTISNNLSVCDDCMIGAGAVVVKDIENVGVYVGVPARCKMK